MGKLYCSLVVIIVTLFCSQMNAQDNLQKTLSDLSSDAAKAYVAPVVSGFGANLNSGWVHRIVPAHKYSLDIELTFVGMGTFFNDNNKTLSTSGIFRFNTDQAMAMTTNISDQNARNAINILFKVNA